MSEQEFVKRSCEEFTQLLSSAAPVPGGGGGCAVVAALGVALGNMVANLTAGKKKYLDVADEIERLHLRCDALQGELLALVEQDAACFAPLLAAYKMPADTQAEKAQKDAALARTAVDACAAPLAIMEKCAEGIDLIREIARIGNRGVLSDAGCGVSFCRAALESASLNVFINTRGMKDRAAAARLETRANALLAQSLPLAEETFAQIRQGLLT